MEFAITIGYGGAALLVLGALAFGVVAQFFGQAGTSYLWLVDGIAAGVAALVASEFVVGWRAIDPVVDGLAVLPALIAGLIVGAAADVITRWAMGGRYTGRALTA
jgi:hypothetical protein